MLERGLSGWGYMFALKQSTKIVVSSSEADQLDILYLIMQLRLMWFCALWWNFGHTHMVPKWTNLDDFCAPLNFLFYHREVFWLKCPNNCWMDCNDFCGYSWCQRMSPSHLSEKDSSSGTPKSSCTISHSSTRWISTTFSTDIYGSQTAPKWLWSFQQFLVGLHSNLASHDDMVITSKSNV